MSSQPVRSYLVIAAAVVIAGVLISASLFVAVGGAKTTTVTSTSTQTTTVVSQNESTVTSVTTFSWLTANPCSGSGGTEPCWDFTAYTSGDAYVFNCMSAAATAQGCTQRVVSTASPHPSYTINITMLSNPWTVPQWANCSWKVPGTAPQQGYGYCLPVNSTAFIMGMPLQPVGSSHPISNP